MSERTAYPGEMAEVALAHRISNTVEAAYRRGDMIEKRRKMMDDWAGYLFPEQVAPTGLRILGTSWKKPPCFLPGPRQ